MYRFVLDISSTEYTVNPIYEGLTKAYEKQSGEVFFREKLSEKLRFVRDDFDLINQETFETLFTLILQKKVEGIWIEDSQAYFYKTDCEFDLGRKIIEVQPRPKDQYDDILAGLDKEFDLIELAPAITPLQLVRQPLIQIHIQGATFINNYLGGVYWEQPIATIPSLNELLNDYHFVYTETPMIMTGDSSTLVPDISGEYSFVTNIRSDGKYEARFNSGANRWEILDLDNGAAVVYQGGVGELQLITTDGFDRDNTAIFTSLSNPSSQCQMFAPLIHARILSNLDEINGNPTLAIPENDVAGDNYNYTRVLGLSIDTIIRSVLHSTDPTRWGRFEEDSPNFGGEYFEKPVIAGTEQPLPVSRSNWKDYSLWFYYDSVLRNIQEDGSENLTLSTAYKVADVLAVLLQKIAPGITHQEDQDHSKFLYGTGDIRGPKLLYPIITPKSNIVIGDYDQPAQKAPIKLSDVFALLWVFYKAKWYIDDENRLRIEHIEYFRNGLSYDGPQTGVDLTTLLEPKTGKNWGYRTNNFKYNKSTMPERMEFKWMDQTSIPFDGYPIDIRSPFVDKGNVQQWAIPRFTADVDFIQANPSDVTKEGFVFFEAVQLAGVYSLPFVELNILDETFKVQNGFAALLYAHQQYHRYEMPAEEVTINETETTALSTVRPKEQEIEFGIIAEPDPMQLAKTGLGDGQVAEMEVNLTSGAVKLKLNHDKD